MSVTGLPLTYFIHLPMKMESIVSSEMSAIRTQTPGNYPKRNNLHLEHGESLRTRWTDIYLLPYSRPFLHPPPEEEPCRGDRDPLSMGTEYV